MAVNFNNIQFLKQSLTRLPHNIYLDEVGTWAATGGLLSAAVSAGIELAKERKKRNWWKPLWWGLGGAAAGGVGGLVYENVMENLSTRYANKIKDPVKELYPKITKAPGKVYNVHFHGMNRGQVTKGNDYRILDEPEKNRVTVEMPGFYTKWFNEWAKDLPKDAVVNLSGHSYGAGRLHALVNGKLEHPINNVVMADPIIPWITALGKAHASKQIKNLKVVAPKQLSSTNSEGNAKILWPLRLKLIAQAVNMYPEAQRVLRGFDHSMLDSRFRLTKHPKALSNLADAMATVTKNPNDSNSYWDN